MYPSLGDPISKKAQAEIPFALPLLVDPAAPAPTATLELLQAGQVLAQIPFPLDKPDATGRLIQTSRLPSAAIPPGIDELRVTVVAGGTPSPCEAPRSRSPNRAVYRSRSVDIGRRIKWARCLACRSSSAFSWVILRHVPSRSDAAAQGWRPCRRARALRYTLSFPAPQTHYVEVEAGAHRGRPQIDSRWRCGRRGRTSCASSRGTSKTSQASAGDSREAVEKTSQESWRVQTGGAPSVTVRYRVYGREMSVRTNFIEADFALINGARDVSHAGRRHRATAARGRADLAGCVEDDDDRIAGASGGSPHHYRAADFDTLVDSPIVAGNPAVYEFSVKGKPHFLVNVGEGGVWDGPRSAADVQKIVEAQAAFWGDLPYDKYVFINMITEGTGGLEHRNSTVLMTSRWRTRTRRGYVDWLSLVSHEFFHAGT